MAEKGGKGFSEEGGKTASKSLAEKQGSLKGKDDSTSMNARVILSDSSDSDSEGFIDDKSQISPKTNGKTQSNGKSGKKVAFEDLKTGGDSGKGGKGFNAGKAGGKGSLPEAKSLIKEVELKLEIELPKNTRILLDCEAAEVLQGVDDHLAVLLEDPNIKIPESFKKALQYSKINSHYTNAQSARKALENLKGSGATDGEICMIGNILPESVDEVYALVPSLKANRIKNEGPIKDALANLAEFRTPS